MSSPDYSTLGFKDLIVTLDGGVALVQINRPTQRNTWGGTFPLEIVEVFELLDRDDRVRVVVFSADPKAPAYCSGADLSQGWGRMWSPESEKEGPHAHRDSGGKGTIAILRCRKITIAAVNGHAVGVGMTALNLPFDIRFIWGGAKLAFPFIRRGITPEATSTYLLPRLLGHAKANALFLTGETFTPDSPFIRDLYYKILPSREEVLPAALSFAKDLAENTSQLAVAYTKGLLLQPGASIEENHILDSRSLKILASGADAAEGAKAFIERRPVNFKATLSKDSSPWYPWWTTVDVRHRRSKL